MNGGVVRVGRWGGEINKHGSAQVKYLHLFVGTTKRIHNVVPNPFVIVGIFTRRRRRIMDKGVCFPDVYTIFHN